MSAAKIAESKVPEPKIKQEVKADDEGDTSDDDIPIALLVQQQQQQQQLTSPAVSTLVPTPSGRTPRTAAVKAAARPVVDDDSSDDDTPIAQLVAKSQASSAKAKVKAPADAQRSGAKKRKMEVTRPAPAKKSKATTSKKRMSIKHRTEALYETEKGELVQNLLCRWWYAMEWPTETDLRPAPAGYEVLDGYRGVYICTRADNLGHIIDTRNMQTAPTFDNFSRMPSAQLKELLCKAYDNQINELIAHEGEGTKLERQLKVKLSKVKRLNTDKADRGARKLLS